MATKKCKDKRIVREWNLLQIQNCCNDTQGKLIVREANRMVTLHLGLPTKRI